MSVVTLFKYFKGQEISIQNIRINLEKYTILVFVEVEKISSFY